MGESWIHRCLPGNTNDPTYRLTRSVSHGIMDGASIIGGGYALAKGAYVVTQRCFAARNSVMSVQRLGRPTTSSPATSSMSAHRLKNKLIAEEISHGHAFTKHVIQKKEFPGFSRFKFEQHLKEILDNPTKIKPLTSGRTAYWDQTSGTVIIRNPAQGDGGTAFRPTAGYDYFFKELK